MSLAIQIGDVVSVLLADGWHEVENTSFTIDSYEYLEDSSADSFVLHGGGQSGICATGFRFLEDTERGTYLAGPLSAILAVRLSLD